MKSIKDYIAEAQQLLIGGTLDKSVYAEIENFVLKNGSRFAGSVEFASLKQLMGEIANKFNIRSIETLQEGFGLNSCSQ